MEDIKTSTRAVPELKTPTIKKPRLGGSQSAAQRKIQSFFTKSPTYNSPTILSSSPLKKGSLEKDGKTKLEIPLKQPRFKKITPEPTCDGTQSLSPQEKHEEGAKSPCESVSRNLCELSCFPTKDIKQSFTPTTTQSRKVRSRFLSDIVTINMNLRRRKSSVMLKMNRTLMMKFSIRLRKGGRALKHGL